MLPASLTMRSSDQREALAQIRVVAFDIDGTLTDATTSWLGPELGWTQTYSTRDGEAILELVRAGLVVVPISRNRTITARTRMESLKLRLDWLGTADKLASITEASAALDAPLEHFLFVGDGREDAAIFERVGMGCAVRDAHPLARARARWVLERAGGERVMEEIAEALLAARGATETAS